MKYRPSAEKRAQIGLENVFKSMEREERRKKDQMPKSKKYGVKQVFIEDYEKNGYESAKKNANAKFGREVYTDEMLITWLGIEAPRKSIFEAYKNGTIEDAYAKADEINEKIGCLVIKKEMVDLWIAEEIEKEKKKAKTSDRDEDDDAR